MIQIGIIMIAMAIESIMSGRVVMGLFCLAGGLQFISVRKGDMGMKVTLKSLMTPVDDSDKSGVFEVVSRLMAYAALAGGIAIFVSRQL